MVLDLGSGALGPLQRHVRLNDVDAVCISHLHVDRYMDMCPYWVVRNYAPGGTPPPIPVYGPAGTANRLALAYGLDPDPGMTRVFDFVTLSPGRREIGPFSVTAGHVNHPVETFGFRIEYGGPGRPPSPPPRESPPPPPLAPAGGVPALDPGVLHPPRPPPH